MCGGEYSTDGPGVKGRRAYCVERMVCCGSGVGVWYDHGGEENSAQGYRGHGADQGRVEEWERRRGGHGGAHGEEAQGQLDEQWYSKQTACVDSGHVDCLQRVISPSEVEVNR